MTTPLPMVAEAINAGGPVSIAWRNWLETVNRALTDGSLSVAALQEIVSELQAQIDALSDGGTITGLQSVKALGSLASGGVALLLEGDTPAPGELHFYGTSDTGAKGFVGLHPLVMSRVSLGF